LFVQYLNGNQIVFLNDNLPYEPDLRTDVAIEEEAQLPSIQKKHENMVVSSVAKRIL
jgi:hypothetical protein